MSGIDLSIWSYRIETWASVCVGLICGGFLIFAYVRRRIPALLQLAIGNVLYLIYSFADYRISLSGAEPSVASHVILVGLFVAASAITAVGMALLCIRLSKPTI